MTLPIFAPAKIYPLCAKCCQVESEELTQRSTATKYLGGEIHLKWGLYGTPLCKLSHPWLDK